MVVSEYSASSCKSLNKSIGSIIKNPEMLWFVPNHLKTEKMWKHVVKTCFLTRYVTNWCKTQEMWDKVILQNGGMLKSVPDCYKNKNTGNKAVNIDANALECV